MQGKDAHNDELERIARRLRAERPQVDPLELDRIKTSAISHAMANSGHSSPRRFAVAGLVVGLMAAGTGGVIAAGGASHPAGNAAIAQYAVPGAGTHHPKHHSSPAGGQLHIQLPRGAKLATVTILVDNKIVSVRKGSDASPDINLELFCSTRVIKVTVIAVTDNGETIKESRHVGPCRGKQTRRLAKRAP
jgi:hypothetical protein